MSDRFSADEARRIFARAARRQHAAPTEDGLTVADLEAIAREAGLDPSLVAAEATAERIGQDVQKTWHGVPIGICRARLLPSRLSDAEWERVVDLLRAEYKTPGAAEQIGRRREWAAAGGSSSSASTVLRVRVEQRPEGDLVTVEAPDTNRLVGIVLGATFGGMSAFTAVLVALMRPEEPAVAFTMTAVFALIGLLCYGGALLSARVAADRTPDRLEGLLDRIDLISRLDDASAPPTPSGRLDSSLLNAEAADATDSLRPRRRVRS